jgi:hypothetical protein
VVARPAAADDRLDRRLDELVVHRDLELHLADEVHGNLVAPVGLRMAPLAAEALHVEHREAKDLDLGERLLHALELAGLDDRDDELHRTPPFEREPPEAIPRHGATTSGRTATVGACPGLSGC